jgi:hypothetical protein
LRCFFFFLAHPSIKVLSRPVQIEAAILLMA